MSIYWTHTILQASKIFHVYNETTIYYQYLFFTNFFFFVVRKERYFQCLTN